MTDGKSADTMKISEAADLARQSSERQVVDDLSLHDSRTVRIAAASNLSASDAAGKVLLSDKDPTVRLVAAAENLELRPRLYSVAGQSLDEDVRAVLASMFLERYALSLPPRIQYRLAKDASAEVQGRMAATTDDNDIFENLLKDAATKVRAYCASNPRINREQMQRLVTDRTAEVRTAVVGNGLRFPDEAQLMTFAADRSSAVRWAVIFRVDRPREALQLLAADPDDFNREHAERALQSEHLINAPAVVSAERERRSRAGTIATFPESS